MSKIKIKILLYSVLSVFLLVLALTSTQTSAGWFCDKLGTGGLVNKNKSPLLEEDTTILQSKGQRKYTVFELFGEKAAAYSTPYGENKNGNLIRAKNSLISDKYSLDADQTERLNNLGEENGCAVAFIQPGIQNLTKSATDFLSNLVTTFIEMFFDNNFICSNPDDVKGVCLDLMGIAGGKSTETSGGLIGKLGKGIFFPMLTVVFLINACYYIYIGLIKRRFRETIQGMLWSFIPLALGIWFTYNAYIPARAPQEAITVIGTCVANVLSGGDCINSADDYKDNSKDLTCAAYSKDKLEPFEKNQLYLKGLACNISKQFTINRWTIQQFGYRYDQLFTMNAPTGNEVYPANKLQGEPEDYCVHMETKESPDDFQTGKINIVRGKVKVCNIALAYMANTIEGMDFGNKADMEQIIATAAKDQVMWNAFTGNGRDILGIFSMIGVVVVALTFLPLTVKGIAYSIISTLLVILSPIFLLFAIHPGKGKNIFLKWLNQIGAYILKYAVIGLLIIIMVNVYSYVYEKSTSTMVLVMSIILMVAFKKSEAELQKLVNPSNNSEFKGFEKIRDKAKALTSGYVGGKLGGAVASVQENMENGDNFMQAMSHIDKDMVRQGGSEGLGMELRRGRNALGNIARASNQVRNIKKREVEQSKSQYREDMFRQGMLDNMNSQVNKVVNEMEFNANKMIDNNNYNELISSIDNTLKTVTNSSLQKSIQSNRDNIATMPIEKVNTVKTNYQMQNNESINIQNYLNKFGGNKGTKHDNAINEYIKDYSNLKNVEINNNVNKLRNELNGKLSTEDITKEVNTFRMSQFNDLSKHISDLRSQIEFDKSKKGETKINKVNLENIIFDKSRFQSEINNSINKKKQELSEKYNKEL